MKTIFYSLKWLILIFGISLIISSCKKDIDDGSNVAFKKVNEYNYEIVYEWNNVWTDIERYAEGYRPGPVSNSLGYVGLASYEACIEGMPQYNSLASRYSGLKIPQILPNQEYHWPSVVNAVNNYLFSRLFPEVDPSQYIKIKAINEKYEKQFQSEVGQNVFLRSKNHGESVAAAIWDWMKTDVVTFDKYKNVFEDYKWESRFKKNGDWRATYPGPGAGMFPYWGNGRTMAINADQKICRPFSSYAPYSEDSKSGFYAMALEVMAQNTPSLSYQTEWLGEFWSDDLLGLTFSPPSRWIAIANQVYYNEKANMEEAIVANAKVGIALHDAGIGCWNSKYYYNLERPQTYINRLIDPTWKPNLDNPLTGDKGITPSFPAYPSGHATFSSASAEVLASVFGYSYGMTDNCHKNRPEFSGYPRTYSSFYEMALENAWSRVPLGVHFRMDAEEGVRYGTEIGRTVNRLPWKK
ncbi:MAG: vanadium-dependent haloperoxidase [Saprospiraceae bacterium]|jgi:membrane-associated phospholipid phosphatase|nr:vanadium-dependent haloperoxidase [Saprospiraceae bacterium]MBL0023717.1 vanadium-dependent haloperoxidase [Saprospiraceae bacterium]